MSDFESWKTKQIKESSLIGGRTKTLYKLGGTWDCSNAHAKAMGVDKVSVSVTPEKRGEGTCCRMESTLETVSAIGINFKAFATGSIYTGKMIDVVGMKQSSDPNSAIDMGIPFCGRPSALILDYKALIQNQQAVYAPAKTHVKNVDGRDAGQITLILQHRWEENGHVYAYRVGTVQKKIAQSTDWQNDFRLPVQYGKSSLALTNDRHKTHNSEGKMVCIEEVGFRDDIEPTHLIIQISAGSMPPFTGCPGNIVWCDNIRLAYDNTDLAHAK
ncbi:MAG: PCMD domain-containing protein [Paludibacteraceae bacterium]|nr:PCMD domain-containing protein [Paludibacteraceae bacterium]